MVNDLPENFVEGTTYPTDNSENDNVAWVPIADVIAVLEKDWHWIRNSSCKYIDLHIDTRDLHCILYDRDHKRITLDQLRYQYQFGGENVQTSDGKPI